MTQKTLNMMAFSKCSSYCHTKSDCMLGNSSFPEEESWEHRDMNGLRAHGAVCMSSV